MLSYFLVCIFIIYYKYFNREWKKEEKENFFFKIFVEFEKKIILKGIESIFRINFNFVVVILIFYIIDFLNIFYYVYVYIYF